jgi:hypothetical protein
MNPEPSNSAATDGLRDVIGARRRRIGSPASVSTPPARSSCWGLAGNPWRWARPNLPNETSSSGWITVP